MKKCTITQLKESMSKRNITTNWPFIADGEVNCFSANGKLCHYIIDLHDIEIGIYLYDDIYIPCSSEARVIKDGADYQAKKKSLKKLLKTATTRGFSGKQNKVSTGKSTIMLKEIDPIPSDYSTEDNYAISEPNKSIEELANMPTLAYFLSRENEAKKRNIRVSELNAIVKEARIKAVSPVALGPTLISDIVEIFNQKRVEEIRSGELILLLSSAKNSIWNKLHLEGKFNTNQLARILKEFDIKSTDIRFKTDNKVLKGYIKNGFIEAQQLITEINPEWI